MSYILDALRRSQAERERGQVPGLNAQPVAAGARAAANGDVPRRWALPMALLAATGVALLGWWWLARPAAAPRPAAMAAPSQAPTLPAATVPVAAPLPMVVSAPAPVPLAPDPAAPVPGPALTPAAALPAVPAQAPATVAAGTPPMPATPAAPRSVKLAELSAEQRRELPPLALGGSIWSESVLARFVIFNGQVVREGESAAPGVVVERIGPKMVWLRWRDMRVEVPL